LVVRILAAIMLNSNQIPWVNKVEYLGVHFCCNTGITDLSDICRKFYGQFNSSLIVLGKCSNEMAAVHLTKTLQSTYSHVWMLNLDID